MSAHSPEPWQVSAQFPSAVECGQPGLHGERFALVANCYSPADANAARIVACINFCAGLTNDQLAGGAILIDATELNARRPRALTPAQLADRCIALATDLRDLVERDHGDDTVRAAADLVADLVEELAWWLDWGPDPEASPSLMHAIRAFCGDQALATEPA